MRARLLETYAFIFARPRFYRFNRFVFESSLRGLGLLNYRSTIASGELWFLERHLKGKKGIIVFDVGANVGEYARQVLKFADDAQVHCFEPHPVTFSHLVANVGGKVIASQVAVGRDAGNVVLYDYADQDGSQHASILKGVFESLHRSQSVCHEVEAITLASYCEKHSIPGIDLLKIDTEGSELSALRGLGGYLRPDFVKRIHFEFNEMNVLGRVFFKDFWDTLSRNYRIYRLLRGGVVEIKNYSALHCELFAYQNIAAVAKELDG